MDHTVTTSEKKESSAVQASSQGSCSEAPCGAAEQDPVEQRTGGSPLIGEKQLSVGCQTSENLEGLTEKVSTLGLPITKKNYCGAAKKWARRARLAEAPAGASGSGQPRPALADEPHTQQKPGTAPQGRGSAPAKWTSLESGGSQRGLSKRQQSVRGTLEDGQARRPKQIGQPSYTRASREGHRVTVVCEDYPKSQVSREYFAGFQ